VASTQPDIQSRALAMASVRAAIGAASILAPRRASRIMGYPAEHDSATARLVGRLFGVREVLLAWLVLDASRRPDGLSRTALMTQAAVDAGDVAVQLWPLVRREGIARGAAGGAVVAAGAAIMWSGLARAASDEPPPEAPPSGSGTAS
jgi:hypothetical protein